MVRLTVADLVDAQVFTILRELKAEWRPLQSITEEVLIFQEARNLVLVDEENRRTRFTKQYIDLVRRTFKDIEWYLSAPSKRESVGGMCLLIGIWPENHYLVLAPKKEKRPDK